MSEEGEAFYAKHYSDWTVHELPLMVYVPLVDNDREAALALVQEILTDAAFDIRVRVIPPVPAVVHEPRCNTYCIPGRHHLTDGIGYPHLHRTDLTGECGECVTPSPVPPVAGGKA
jgi:hypothetical protein